VSAKLQAPRGTFDVLPADAPPRQAVERTAQRILEAAGYRRIETPAFEQTELFARGVGEATDIVQKEMYSFEGFSLRPEGTAPVCRAYLEHGMHKLPQPVKLWYLGAYFRHERPQAGRYRQFWQVGEQQDRLGVERRVVGAERLEPHLGELAVAARLRRLVAEERSPVPELHRLGRLVHAVLDVCAADRGGALGPERERAAALIVEREHLLLDHVGRVADPALEQLGGLEDGCLHRPVSGAAEYLLGEVEQAQARPPVVGQHVEGAARRL